MSVRCPRGPGLRDSVSAVDPTLRSKEKGLGARMKAARVAGGLGLRVLAQQVGMSPSSLSEFENGKSMLGAARLEELSRVLGVPLEVVPPLPEGPWFEHWRAFEPVVLDPVTEAALHIFTELGYHGSTMRMIAERCGLSVAGVYHHAESKQELLSRMLGRGIRELADRCAAAEAEGATPEERLVNLTECLVLFHLHRRRWAVLAATELRSLGDDDKTRLVDSRRDVRLMVQAAISDIRGKVPAEVPAEPTARAIVTMCVSVADWYDERAFGPAEELTREYVALALGMADGGRAPGA